MPEPSWLRAAPMRMSCQVSYGYGLFTGGPGLNGGSHKVGCLTIPTSSGNTERQIHVHRETWAPPSCAAPPPMPPIIGETIEARWA